MVLSIGENNVVQRKDAAADVDAAAVQEILALIAAKQPQAKVIFKPTQPLLPLLKEICGK